jgi:hypothetical protein
VARARAQRDANRRGVRPAQPTVVGPPAYRVVQTHREAVPSARGHLRAQRRTLHHAARHGGVPRAASAASQPRPTHARRPRGVHAVRASDPLPRRTHDRPRHRRQGEHAHVHRGDEPRLRHDDRPDDPRPRRRRAAVPAIDPHRPWSRAVRRRRRAAESQVCAVSDPRRRTCAGSGCRWPLDRGCRRPRRRHYRAGGRRGADTVRDLAHSGARPDRRAQRALPHRRPLVVEPDLEGVVRQIYSERVPVA